MDYRVKVGNKVKTYHINLLKKYEERDDYVVSGTVSIVEAAEEDDVGVIDDENLLDLPGTSQTQTYRDVDVNQDLTDAQKKDVDKLLADFQDIFTDKPGTTATVEHSVSLTTDTPVRVSQYPIPYAKRQEVENEIVSMLESGIIEPAVTEYNSPIVMVKKRDGTNRFCVDYRKLNAITRFDTEPMGNTEDILIKLTKDKYFTKIDLSKGYWQIPVEPDSRKVTAFSTQSGTYQFLKMPFGMVNSGATFNRMMRQLLKGCRGAENYVDDILGHTASWEEHMDMLRDLFSRIRNAGLTVKPSKCQIGYHNIAFTGHTVGNGSIGMEEDKVEKIRNAERPETKRQVRAFLGLTGYYRKFIPMFSEASAPLTDLTKKGRPNKVVWEKYHQEAFDKLKAEMTCSPILRMPDFTRQFILQIDASDNGVGAALLQTFEDGIFPIAYASKKLLPREKNYSVIERECLAIVFGIKKFQKYLYGKEFVLQCDHAPLAYIHQCKIQNSRIMRWALFLQGYRFRIEAIKGSDNVFADYLSRQ